MCGCAFGFFCYSSLNCSSHCDKGLTVKVPPLCRRTPDATKVRTHRSRPCGQITSLNDTCRIRPRSYIGSRRTTKTRLLLLEAVVLHGRIHRIFPYYLMIVILYKHSGLTRFRWGTSTRSERGSGRGPKRALSSWSAPE